GVLEEHAREGDELRLAGREVAAAGVELGVEALLLPAEPGAEAELRQHVQDHLVGDGGVEEREVVAQRAAEELHLLRDEPDARTQALEVDVARVDAADPHAPGAGVVEAEDEARERRLARASAAQEAQPAAG